MQKVNIVLLVVLGLPFITIDQVWANAMRSGSITNQINLAELSAVEKKQLARSRQNSHNSYWGYSSGRFSIYDTTFAIIKYTPDGKDDNPPLGVQYSFKYSFWDTGKLLNNGWEAFFAYTGQFDLYWAAVRDSSPVVNRLNNPAVHLRKHFKSELLNTPIYLTWLDFGIEHRSNGQVKEAEAIIDRPGSPNDGQYAAQVAYNNGNYRYFDGISRSANFISMEGVFDFGDSNPVVSSENVWHTRFILSGKYYLTDDSDVYWSNLAGTDVSIEDYDLVVMNLYSTWHVGKIIRNVGLGAEWTFGREFAEIDSFNIELFLPIDFSLWGQNISIPLYARAHIGPMNTLSNYTEKQDYYGVGVAFR